MCFFVIPHSSVSQHQDSQSAEDLEKAEETHQQQQEEELQREEVRRSPPSPPRQVKEGEDAAWSQGSLLDATAVTGESLNKMKQTSKMPFCNSFLMGDGQCMRPLLFSHNCSKIQKCSFQEAILTVL